MKYKVTITETLKRFVIIEAEDQAEAEELADLLASEGIIEIDAECFDGRECSATTLASELDASLFEQFSRSDLDFEESCYSKEQTDVILYLQFEDSTASIYPFATAYDDICDEQISKIAEIVSSKGEYTTDDIHEACEQVLGINPTLCMS